MKQARCLAGDHLHDLFLSDGFRRAHRELHIDGFTGNQAAVDCGLKNADELHDQFRRASFLQGAEKHIDRPCLLDVSGKDCEITPEFCTDVLVLAIRFFCMDGKFDVRSIQTAAHVVLINDVVMNKGPGVVNFDCGCGINGGVRKTAEGAAGPHQERGTEAFSAMQGIGAHSGGEALRRHSGREGVFRNGLCNQF